jgi:hypothetical protein
MNRLNNSLKIKNAELKRRINMDLVQVTTKLNNKFIVAVLAQGSESYNKFGPKFIGRLVGRKSKRQKGLVTSVLSLTILAHNYIAHHIPTEHIKSISEILL